MPLTPAEINALPALMRLRLAERLVQFMGRYRARSSMIAGWVLRGVDWLDAHGEELADLIDQTMGGKWHV